MATIIGTPGNDTLSGVAGEINHIDGIAGDDTDGHIDDLARFVNERTIVIGMEDDPRDPNYEILRANRSRLDRLRDQDGQQFDIAELPMPKPVIYMKQRLPATYMNFYFVNRALLVPTYGDARRDVKAVGILQDLQVLADRLARHVETRAQLAQGLTVLGVEPIEQLAPAWIGQRLEDLVHHRSP